MKRPRKRGGATGVAVAATDAALAVRVPELSPKQRSQALRMFALGNSRARIARRLKVERAAVTMAIADAEASGSLPGVRKRLTTALEQLTEDVILSRMPRPDKVSGYDFGVYVDRMLLLQGQATQIVEVKRDQEDLVKVLDKLQDLAEGKLAKRALPASPQESNHAPAT